jgi:hypothetical protein
VFAGSDRPIVMTGGFLLLPSGETFKEDARPPIIAEFPRIGADRVRARRARVAGFCGPSSALGSWVGERHGFVPMLTAVAREKGVSAFVGGWTEPVALHAPAGRRAGVPPCA